MQLPDSLAERLLGWYAAGHRALPWRQDHEPYHVWLSEIMLQQTRVEAVKGLLRAVFIGGCPISLLLRPVRRTVSQNCGRGWAIIPACAICKRLPA